MGKKKRRKEEKKLEKKFKKIFDEFELNTYIRRIQIISLLKSRKAYLDEADVFGSLTEALTTDVDVILPDDSALTCCRSKDECERDI